MSTFSLDDIRAAAEAKYGSTDIALDQDTMVRLLNPLRLNRENRLALMTVQEQLRADDADQETLLSQAVTLIAESPTTARKLLDAVGGDLAVLAEIFAAYSKGTQAGEAS